MGAMFAASQLQNTGQQAVQDSRFDTFQRFLASQTADQPILSFLISMVASAILAFILGRLYVRCGQALSDRRAFAGNFVLLTMTTMLVISIVKSSLALSLGLVGALSIVRFRAAIKEPEELSYLFLAIALGLGFGANQWAITIVAFLAVAGVIVLKHGFRRGEQHQNLYLTVSSEKPNAVGLDEVVSTLRETCSAVNMTRFDETAKALEAAFQVDIESFERLNATRLALQGLSDSITVSFLESRGIT